MILRNIVLFSLLVMPAVVLSLYGCNPPGNSHRSTPNSMSNNPDRVHTDNTTTDTTASVESRISKLTTQLETHLRELRTRAGEGAENLADDTEKRLEQLRGASRRLASATADERARV